MSGRKPDYKLVAFDTRDTTNKNQGTIGAAWESDKGHITVKLNPGAMLSWLNPVNLVLFPTHANTRPRTRQEEQEDIPF